MLRYVRGNIFEDTAKGLVNPCNTVGTMGAGLARKFALAFPEMYADYKERCAGNSFEIGQPYPYWVSEGRAVINFATKQHWRDPSRIAWIESGLAYLAEHLDEWGIDSLAVPALGCGHGGLDWSSVSDRIERYLGTLDMPVRVYLPM